MVRGGNLVCCVLQRHACSFAAPWLVLAHGLSPAELGAAATPMGIAEVLAVVVVFFSNNKIGEVTAWLSRFGDPHFAPDRRSSSLCPDQFYGERHLRDRCTLFRGPDCSGETCVVCRALPGEQCTNVRAVSFALTHIFLHGGTFLIDSLSSHGPQ